MENKLKISLLIISVVFMSGCNGVLDFSGFFYSAERVDDRFVQSDEWNAAHPFKTLVTDSDSYTLLVAGDSHIGGLVNFNKLVTAARQPGNMGFVIVGDVVTGHKSDYLTLKNALPDFNQVPWFLMVGNHDLFFEGWKTFYEYFGSSTYYFSVQTPTASDLYICLDSGGGTFGGKQLAWLKNVLETVRPSYRYCVVFSHVNFFRDHHSGTTNPLETELEVLLPLFAKDRVNMVINGHDHHRALDKLGITTYLIMDALKDGLPNASFVKLEISPVRLGYEFQDISSLN